MGRKGGYVMDGKKTEYQVALEAEAKRCRFLVEISRAEYDEFVKMEERIETVKRMYETGECYTLDTALSALGIKLRGAERVDLSRMTCDPCADDCK
jgi:hypothetical protein